MGDKVKTQVDLANAVGISLSALRAYWLKRDGFPPLVNGEWDLSAVLEFIKREKQEQLAKTKKKANSRKEELQCQKLEKEIERLEFENGKAMGKYVSSNEVGALMADLAGGIKSAFSQSEQIVLSANLDGSLAKIYHDTIDKILRLIAEKCANGQPSE